MIVGRLPTIPEYYSEHIDKNINLAANPSQCCPFHKESTPSFSFNRKTGKCRCFGRCGKTWDIIDFHRENYKLSSREEAERSLKTLYKVKEQSLEEDLRNMSFESVIDVDKVNTEIYVSLCILHAKDVDRWLELDYVMSRYPLDVFDLRDLLMKWGVDYAKFEVSKDSSAGLPF